MLWNDILKRDGKRKILYVKKKNDTCLDRGGVNCKYCERIVIEEKKRRAKKVRFCLFF